MMRQRTSQNFFNRCEWLSLIFLTLCFFVMPLSVSATTIAYLAAFFFLLISNDWRARWGRIKSNKAAISFWVLAVLFVIGLLYTTSTRYLAWQDFHKRHWLWMTPFFMMIIRDDRWRERMVNTFLYVMLIILGFSYLKFFKLDLADWVPITPQGGVSIFMNHIIQSFAMSIAGFVCGYRLLFHHKHRVLYGVLFTLIAINVLFMSIGRTGYIIFLLLVIYLSLIRFGWRGVLSAVAISAAAFMLVFSVSTNFRYRINEVYVHTTQYQKLEHATSVGQRIQMWHIAEKMIRKRPWFGYGTGGIRTALPTVVPEKERNWSNQTINYVESIYLNFLLQFGVFGLLVLLGVLITQIRVTFQLPQTYKHLMQAVLIALLCGGMINQFMASFPIAHLYSLFAALCFSALNDLPTHHLHLNRECAETIHHLN